VSEIKGRAQVEGAWEQDAKENEVTESWREVHNKEPNNLYSSLYIIMETDQIKEHDIGGPQSMHWRDEECIQDFDWKT
jgi:hypothetical protein